MPRITPRAPGLCSLVGALLVSAAAYAGPPSLPPPSPGPSEGEWEDIIEFNREITEEFTAEVENLELPSCHGESIAEGHLTARDHANWQKHVRTISTLYGQGVDPRRDAQLKADIQKDLKGAPPDLFLAINHEALTCSRERGASVSPEWLPVTGQVFAALSPPIDGNRSRQLAGMLLAPLGCVFGIRVLRARRRTAKQAP